MTSINSSLDWRTIIINSCSFATSVQRYIQDLKSELRSIVTMRFSQSLHKQSLHEQKRVCINRNPIKKLKLRPDLVAHICNPSYLGCGDWEYHISSLDQAKKLVRFPHLNKTNTRYGVACLWFHLCRRYR
jgi:hypothetical protein